MKARGLYCAFRAEELKEADPQKAYQERKTQAQSQWAQLTPAEQGLWFTKAREDEAVPDEGAPAHLPLSTLGGAELRFRGCHGLSTWNGSWGVLPWLFFVFAVWSNALCSHNSQCERQRLELC